MDPRIAKTKEKLKTALLFLLQRDDPANITVSGLCRHAGVDRNTFYAHYQNVGELLDEILREHTDASIALIRSSMEKGEISGMLRDICVMMYENRELSRILNSGSMNHRYLMEVTRACNQAIVEIMKHSSLLRRELNTDLVNRYATGGTLLILQDWCSSGMKESPDKISSQLIEINRIYWSCFLAEREPDEKDR